MQDLFQIVTQLLFQGYLGLFVACFIINMIPFLSPSNMVLAGVVAISVSWMDWRIIGLTVAVAAVTAKTIHYAVIRFSRKVLSEQRLKSLDMEKARVEKWGALALFIAAASPIPDDPLVVYTALTKYSPTKFIVSYFTGKVAVTLAGAFIGYVAGGFLEGAPIIVASVVLTALITGFLLKRKTEGSTPSTQESHNS
jgi:membrane protein YqaA with SNARE-associated domain